MVKNDMNLDSLFICLFRCHWSFLLVSNGHSSHLSMMGSGPAGRLLLYSLVKVVLQVLKLNILFCQSVNGRYDPGVKSTPKHLCAFVCAPKLKFALVCAPKLLCALIYAPKLVWAPKLVCLFVLCLLWPNNKNLLWRCWSALWTHTIHPGLG